MTSTSLRARSPAPTGFEGRRHDDRTLVPDTGEIRIGGRRHRVLFSYVLESDDVHRTAMRQGWDRAEPVLVSEGRFQRTGT